MPVAPLSGHGAGCAGRARLQQDAPARPIAIPFTYEDAGGVMRRGHVTAELQGDRASRLVGLALAATTAVPGLQGLLLELSAAITAELPTGCDSDH